MKKIVIVDGGPRKNMNTAQLLQRFVEGAKSVSENRPCDSTTLIIKVVCRVWLANSKSRHRISAAFGMRYRHAWRDAHWQEDLQRAYEAGRKMAEQ